MRILVSLAGLLAAGALLAPAAMGAGGVGAHSSRYGTILFDSRGFVLYAFTKDSKGKSACYAVCAKRWPPYLVRGQAPKGKRLGTTRRTDGTTQVTYAGRPLYRYIGDRQPAEILCQDIAEFGGTWLVVRLDGSLVR